MPAPPAPNSSRIWRRRLLAWTSWLAIGYISICCIIAFVLPDFLRIQLQQALSTASYNATIERLRINPLRLLVTANGIELAASDRHELLGVDELRINASSTSLFYRALVLDELALETLGLHAGIDTEGTVNWLRYVDELTPANDVQPPPQSDVEAQSALPRLLVHRLALVQLDASFKDDTRRKPFSQHFGPIDIEVLELSTLPRQGAPYTITASAEGVGTLAWRGDISLEPLRSSGTLELSEWQLPLFWAYFEEQLGFELAAGLAGLKADYQFDGELRLSGASVQLDGLELQDRSEEAHAILNLPQLRVTGVEFDQGQMQLDIGAITLQDLVVSESIDAAGNSRLAQAFTPVSSDEDTASTTAPAAATPAADPATQEFSLRLGQLVLHNASIAAQHQLDANHSADFNLSSVEVLVKDVAFPEGDIEQFSLEGSINDSAALAVQGHGDIDPLQAQVEVNLDGFVLADTLPYIKPLLDIAIDSGRFSVQAKLDVTQQDDGLVSHAAAAAQVEELLITDTVKGAKILGIDGMQVVDLAWDSEAPSLQIAQVAFSKAYAKVLIFDDGSSNLSRLVVEQEQAQERQGTKVPSSEPDAKPEKAVQVDIASIDFVDSTADFTDRSLPREFHAAIYGIKGGVKGISSTASAAAAVDITGSVDRYAPVTLAGEVKPLSDTLFVDLELAFRNMELTSVSPYSDTYAGYDIDKGKLNADFKYRIEGSQLQAENSLIVDQLTLGERTESATATSLPVGLAIALLKDKNGVIDLNLPISGDIDDPEFSYGALVGKALLNLVTKIVTAPFAALGKLVGGGEDMDYIPFEAGRGGFAATEASKLTQLAEALQQRPQLSVSIRGVAAREPDSNALREASLKAALKERELTVPAAGDSWKPVYKYYKETTERSVRDVEKQLAAEQSLENDALQTAVQSLVWADLLAAQNIGDEQLELLARHRAEAVRESLVGAGIDPVRLFLLDPDITDDGAQQGHCKLSLEAS